MRYVDEGYCSFFPGKVLDELRRVYVTIKSSNSEISRSTEILRELRDISSMAMEYFDEILLPQIYESKCKLGLNVYIFVIWKGFSWFLNCTWRLRGPSGKYGRTRGTNLHYFCSGSRQRRVYYLIVFGVASTSENFF